MEETPEAAQPTESDDTADATPETEPEAPQDADGTDWKAEARKWEKRAKDNSDAAARLKEIEDRDKTEAQRAAEKAAEAEQRATEAEAKALRYEVAVEEGVPKHLHRFLTGTSREELAEQAAALLEALPNGDDEQAAGLSRRPQQRLRPGAIPSSDPEPPDMNRLIRRAAGR